MQSRVSNSDQCQCLHLSVQILTIPYIHTPYIHTYTPNQSWICWKGQAAGPKDATCLGTCPGLGWVGGTTGTAVRMQSRILQMRVCGQSRQGFAWEMGTRLHTAHPCHAQEKRACHEKNARGLPPVASSGSPVPRWAMVVLLGAAAVPPLVISSKMQSPPVHVFTMRCPTSSLIHTHTP